MLSLRYYGLEQTDVLNIGPKMSKFSAYTYASKDVVNVLLGGIDKQNIVDIYLGGGKNTANMVFCNENGEIITEMTEEQLMTSCANVYIDGKEQKDVINFLNLKIIDIYSPESLYDFLREHFDFEVYNGLISANE